MEDRSSRVWAAFLLVWPSPYLDSDANRPLPRPRRVGGGKNPRPAPADRRPRRRPVDAHRRSRRSSASCWPRALRRGSIGLRAKQSFTTYSQLDRDTLVLVLSGAYRDRLAARTWWFPIVGRVPYKGYFDFPGARRRQRRQLERRRLRRVPPAVAGIQHARMVQRSAALDVARAPTRSTWRTRSSTS